MHTHTVATVAGRADACLVLLTTGTPLVCIAVVTVVHLYGTVQGVTGGSYML